LRSLYARISCRRPEGNRPLSFERCAAWSVYLTSRLSAGAPVTESYLRLRAVFFERPLAREGDFRVVREAVLLRGELERAVLLRRVVRDVDLRAVDFRAVDLRADDLRADDLRVVLREAVLRAEVLRPEVLRAEVLRPEVLRAEVLRPEVLRAEALRAELLRAEVLDPDVLRRDAPVLPERSRRFVRVRLRLFSAGLS
jgi:hypothetical protein